MTSSLECGLNACKKSISRMIGCLNCCKNYCNTKCLEIHLMQCKVGHKDSPEKKINHLNVIGTHKIRSSLIKDGEYHFEINYDKTYEIKNIDLLRHRVIGNGIFGNIYLAKNNKNNKYIAVKQA